MQDVENHMVAIGDEDCGMYECPRCGSDYVVEKNEGWICRACQMFWIESDGDDEWACTTTKTTQRRQRGCAN